jgi:hypothetical protein
MASMKANGHVKSNNKYSLQKRQNAARQTSEWLQILGSVFKDISNPYYTEEHHMRYFVSQLLK